MRYNEKIREYHIEKGKGLLSDFMKDNGIILTMIVSFYNLVKQPALAPAPVRVNDEKNLKILML